MAADLDETMGSIETAESIDSNESNETIAESDASAAEKESETFSTSTGYDLDDGDVSSVFTSGKTLSIPVIPEQYRASDVIGRRTQASSSSNAIRIGKMSPKARLRSIWDELTDTEKYALMLVSEHRHMTAQQLKVLIVQPTRLRKGAKNGKVDNLQSYYDFVVNVKYKADGMSYSKALSIGTLKGLVSNVLNDLIARGLLEKITPAYWVDNDKMSERYKEAPSLYTEHYYLTPVGAKVLVCNTAIRTNTAKRNAVGFVPTYKNAAYQSVLHEAECTEVMCSMISCASYASNPDDGRYYGLFDVCRFYHEKDIEEKDVEYNGKKIDFKTDGKVTMYVEQFHDFVDWYIEYDSGSSTSDKIKHKTEAFIKYILWKKRTKGESFRSPVLLLISQKPSDYFPQAVNRKTTTYTTGIKQMAKRCFPDMLDELNDIALVLVADCGSIRSNGALGACWHRMDLTTGIPEDAAYDLITASKPAVSNRIV